LRQAFLGLGSNVGDRLRNLRFAVHSLEEASVVVETASHVYLTEPLGYTSQDPFLNAVLEVSTELAPLDLLELCQRIEDRAGRERTVRWGPRTLDIDILLYEDTEASAKYLTIPHPRMLERRFVLEPLSELADELPDRTTIDRALAECPDTSSVEVAGTLVALGDIREVPLAFIGTGKVGSAMAGDLRERGFTVDAVYDADGDRCTEVASAVGARAAKSEADAAGAATVVFVTTQDSHIRSACERASGTGGDMLLKTFVHMSGSLSLESMDAARRKGALLASIHPVQTFADSVSAARDLPGSTFSMTGSAGARAFAMGLVEELAGRPVPLADEDKALYHSAAVIAGNLTNMLIGAAAEIYRGIGFEERQAVEAALPLARTTLSNIEKLGAAEALTGPLARGDLSTLEANLEALDATFPEAAAAYRAVSLLGLRLVIERGAVDDATILAMKALLEGGAGAEVEGAP
jgi:2-amino-4-hydroxy-6-hydroxymethyldihydropteridine diphosphokinase